MNYRQYVAYSAYAPAVVLQTLLIGFVSGVIFWLLQLGLVKYVLTPIFCGATNASYCSSVPTVAVIIALVVAHFVGLVALVRAGVLRPLLVVLASVITLLGMHLWLAQFSWWEASLYAGMLVGLAYLLYAWINRLTVFPVALVVSILAIVATRLIILGW